ncbi:putative aminopeptidase YsdC [bioreactor metagenome]|uniref:Putative aminopeptidase YsdC n=1 Tax=bioreactor metagenome TaxID=1076179 RepID=A0A645E9Z1_9ZZZZ
MFIDMGVDSKEELEQLGIRVGDMITPRSEFEVMNNPNYLIAKAWDDRIGALIAVDVVRKLKGVKHDFDIYAVGTVQEEVGLRGAKTAAYAIKPDLAIALDVTIASDYPGGENRIKCGAGVTVELLDASHLGHRGFIQYIENICAAKKIAFQLEQLTGGGTDSGEINKSYDGIINITISIPSRYCHSHHTIIHRKDYIDTVEVIVELCKQLNQAELEKIRTSNR